MPNYVSIELNENKLLVACGKSAGRGFQIQQLFDIAIEADESDARIGEKLKLALGEKGVSRAEVIGVAGRRDAEIREVTVPPAPDDELPDLVRFQARNVFASLNDNWLFDFVPFERDGEEQQRVLAVAIGPQVKKQLESISASAGLKLKRIVFHPYAICDLFAGLLLDTDHRLLIVPSENRFDLAVARGSQLVVTRTFVASGEQDTGEHEKQVVGEIKRTIASLQTTMKEERIHQLIVGADKKAWPQLDNELKEQFDLPVVFFDPLQCLDPAHLSVSDIPDRTGRFAATLGAIVREYSNRQPEVDFLNPRRPIVKKQDLKTLLIPLAVAALFVLAGAGYCWYLLGQQTVAMEASQKELNDLLEFSEQNEQSLLEVGELDQWQATKVNWLDEIAWISDKLLTPDDVIISRFRGVESRAGFKIELNSQVTEARSKDTTWKHLFDERYEAPVFGNTSSNPDSADHPVNRPFNLIWNADVEATAEKFGQIAFDRLVKEREERERLAEQPASETAPTNVDTPKQETLQN